MKKFLLALFFIAGAVIAQADDYYLYWMLGENPASTGTSDNYYAMVKSSGGEYLSFYTKDGSTYALVKENGAFLAGAQYKNYLGADPGSSFMIELWNDTGAEAAYTTGWLDLGNYASRGTDPTKYAPILASSFHAVPEPTSGMMLLVGAMLLGLKRKRV